MQLSVSKTIMMRYQSGRYISTSEAVWRILSFHIHKRFSPVFQTDFHLENGQRVYFDHNNVRERVVNPRNTPHMAFLKLCQEDNFAKTNYLKCLFWINYFTSKNFLSLSGTSQQFNSMLSSFRQDGRPIFLHLKSLHIVIVHGWESTYASDLKNTLPTI